MKLPQSNVIFFCLIVAFMVFITLRGELPAYLNILFTTQGQAGSGTGGGSSAQTGAAGAIGNTLGTVGSFIDQNTGSDQIGSAVTSFRNMLPSLPSLGSIGSFLGL